MCVSVKESVYVYVCKRGREREREYVCLVRVKKVCVCVCVCVKRDKAIAAVNFTRKFSFIFCFLLIYFIKFFGSQLESYF